MTVSSASVPGILQTGIHSARPAATAVGDGSLYSCTTHGLIYQSLSGVWTTWLGTGVGLVSALSFLIDGGGATITTGIKGDLEVPFACTITAWRVFADQAGAIAVAVWKDSYANFPPVVGDLLVTPTIAATNAKAETTGLSLALAAGDILRFNVNSVTSIQRATVSLTVSRT